jgi:2-oxoglutarate dehydrogenase E1 component
MLRKEQVTRPLTAEEKRALLQRLTEVDGLERFLGRAYQGKKRFSIEGTDAMVPMLDAAVGEGAQLGIRQVVIGMAHRGRLNVLKHVLGKPRRCARCSRSSRASTPTRTPTATPAT